MMLRLLLSTLLALLVFFSLTPTTPVFAFEVSVAEENPELELYQPNSCFYYSVNELGTEDLSVDDLLPIIRRAFNAWEDVSGSFFYFLPSEPPTTTVNRAEINWDKGNVNLLVWHVTADDWYTDDRHTPRTVALTQVDYNTETGEILNADIEFNDFDFDFGSAMSGSSDVVDLQTVITHEIGHTIGLADLYLPEDRASTMYGFDIHNTDGSPSTDKRILAQDDINGIRYLYPSNEDPAVCKEPVCGLDLDGTSTSCKKTGSSNGCQVTSTGLRQSMSLISRLLEFL